MIMLTILVYFLQLGTLLIIAKQTIMSSLSSQWKVVLSNTWDVLGPFPIHAREQHYLSPSFPLDLSEPIDLNRTWPSSYADGGRVSWSTAQSDTSGVLNVSFPAIRKVVWKSLRMTEGWAALQYHAVLRTSLTIYPPVESDSSDFPQLLVHLIQGSYFTVLPAHDVEGNTDVPEWYSGNIYNMECSLPRIVNLPVLPSLTQPTKYIIFVSGDYEIRLFGDPNTQHSDIPIQNILLSAYLEFPTDVIIREPSQDIICDFVEGFAFGEAIGIGIRSVSGWWTAEDVVGKNENGITLTLRHKSRISPNQMRIIPISIHQDQPFKDQKLGMEITLVADGVSKVLPITIEIRHRTHWTPTQYNSITATYFYAQSMPSKFKVIPPIMSRPETINHPILALHGAGVDIIEQPFWVDSLPRNRYSWIIIPTGRTSWGLDWHGPSALDAWASLDALFFILSNNSIWSTWKIDPSPKVVILGHSNGGQGAWYLASHYPDRTIAVIPAAGYIKSQAYVPLTMSRSAHFMDPALRAILESSLTPDDNDLYLSNLVDTPILAIHGGNDENVPVWHTREALGILQALSQDSNVIFCEDAGQGHWYPSIFNNSQVNGFLDRVLMKPKNRRSKMFTVTVSIPSESGSVHGWIIESLIVPGRLGRLQIITDTGNPDIVRVITSNVDTFSVDYQINNYSTIHLDESWISLQPGVLRFKITNNKSWQILQMQPQEVQSPSRIQQVLTSPGPLKFIVPNRTSSRELSITLRIIHDLNTYHRLDAEIILESDALSMLENESPWPNGNIVFIGDPFSCFVRKILEKKKTTFEITSSGLTLNGQTLPNNIATLFLHPHPTSIKSCALFVLSRDMYALERAARLFPIRTGVVAPSWLIFDNRTDHIGAAGIIGAGVWDKDWRWNEALSWLD